MYDGVVLAWVTGFVLMQGPEDRDVDGAMTVSDECPDRAETMNGYQDGDGCPDGVPASLLRIVGRVDVGFATDRPFLRPASLAALGRVAEVLMQHPDVAIRLAARPANAGAAGRALWAGRLAAVRACLVACGIAEERVVTVVADEPPYTHAPARPPGIWLDLVVAAGTRR